MSDDTPQRHGYHNPGNVEESVGPDWDEIDRRLQNIVDLAGLTDDDRPRLAAAIREVLRFAVQGTLSPGVELRVGRRLLALAWTLDPSLIDGSPSLTAVAAALGISKANFAVHTGKVSRRFGIRNRAQSHAWNKKMEVGNGT